MLFTKWCLSGQIKKSEVGKMHGMMGQGGWHTEFWWGNFRERDQLEDLGLDCKIIKGIFNK